MKIEFSKFGLLLAAAMMLPVLPGVGGEAATATPAGGGTKPVSLSDLLADTVVAKGKGFEIKRSRLDQALVSAKANFAASGRPVPANDLPLLELQALDTLILTEALNSQATADEKAKGKETADKQFERIKKEFPNEEALARQLEATGQTLAGFREAMLKQVTANVILVSKIKVTDDEVRKFYEDNPSKFEHPERVRASHILLMTNDPVSGPKSEDERTAKRKQMDDIRKRAVAGEDFGALAKQYSEDPGSKANGGEYVFGRGEMDPAFENAAFALQTNQVSEVISSQYGFHIIKLSEKVPAGKSEFKDVSENIRHYLESMAVEKMIPKYYLEVKKQAEVEIVDDKLKALEEAATKAAASEKSKDNAPGK